MNTDIFRKAVVPVSAGVAGLSVGGVLGFLVGQRRERRNRLRLIQSQHDLMERFTESAMSPMSLGFKEPEEDHPSFATLHDVTKTDKVPYYKPPQNVKDLVDHIRSKDVEVDGELTEGDRIDNDILDMEAEDERQGSVPQNAFSHPYSVEDDNWDWERELQERSNKPIYVITHEEFRNSEMGFRQGTIIFYEGDRMMTDELGEPIYNWTSHVGTELPFGHGTGDENVVFIRNESLKWEYEIQRDPGKYDVEVQAHDIQVAYEEDDIKHMHRPLKMRRE